MSLEVYTRYPNSDGEKTIVAVHDSDPNVFVRFDANLNGNLTGLSDSELLERALAWFTNRYIQSYANQKLDEKVREIDGLTVQMKSTLDEARGSIAENKAIVESKIDKAVSELTTLIMNFMAAFAGDDEEGDVDSPEEDDEATGVSESSEEEADAEESTD